MTSPLYEDTPYHFRILPREPHQAYACFWGCGTSVGGLMEVCEGCLEKLREASVGMQEDRYPDRGYIEYKRGKK